MKFLRFPKTLFMKRDDNGLYDISDIDVSTTIIRLDDIRSVRNAGGMTVICTFYDGEFSNYASHLTLDEVMQIIDPSPSEIDLDPVNQASEADPDLDLVSAVQKAPIPFMDLPVGRRFRFVYGYWSQFNYTKTTEFAARQDGTHSPERLSDVKQMWMVIPLD